MIQSELYGNIQITKLNVSKHRNFITTFRNDDSYSALYAAHEDVFVKIGQGDNCGKLKETIYKMEKKEKVLLDNFLFARNSGLLFNRTSIDANGKSTIVDPKLHHWDRKIY